MLYIKPPGSDYNTSMIYNAYYSGTDSTGTTYNNKRLTAIYYNGTKYWGVDCVETISTLSVQFSNTGGLYFQDPTTSWCNFTLPNNIRVVLQNVLLSDFSNMSNDYTNTAYYRSASYAAVTFQGGWPSDSISFRPYRCTDFSTVTISGSQGLLHYLSTGPCYTGLWCQVYGSDYTFVENCYIYFTYYYSSTTKYISLSFGYPSGTYYDYIAGSSDKPSQNKIFSNSSPSEVLVSFQG